MPQCAYRLPGKPDRLAAAFYPTTVTNESSAGRIGHGEFIPTLAAKTESANSSVRGGSLPSECTLTLREANGNEASGNAEGLGVSGIQRDSARDGCVRIAGWHRNRHVL